MTESDTTSEGRPCWLLKEGKLENKRPGPQTKQIIDSKFLKLVWGN